MTSTRHVKICAYRFLISSHRISVFRRMVSEKGIKRRRESRERRRREEEEMRDDGKRELTALMG
eukprot:441756-Rhodomonas_salina.1